MNKLNNNIIILYNTISAPKITQFKDNGFKKTMDREGSIYQLPLSKVAESQKLIESCLMKIRGVQRN